MFEELRQNVCDANLRIVREGLVLLTWGNVSALDETRETVVIKPSGIPYNDMNAAAMVPVSLSTGTVVEGSLQPSSDTPTHRVLYQAFGDIRAIVHTHSLYGTAWAQAGREIPVLGTTHADHFGGPIPVTRVMKKSEIESDYEANTGKVIVERFRKLDPMRVPAVLVNGHGAFTWGTTLDEAVENAIVLERTAQMAAVTLGLNLSVRPISKTLLEKHFGRKHGPDSYYGQSRK